MGKRLLLGVMLLVFGGGAVVGCSSDNSKSTTEAAPEDHSLYARLGGAPAIEALTKDFVARAANDPKVNFFRKSIPGVQEWKPTSAELATFEKHLAQFIAVSSGGPQKYEGRNMKTTHRGMKITREQFDALKDDLSASLNKFGVKLREKREVLAAVEATAKDIVEVN